MEDKLVSAVPYVAMAAVVFGNVLGNAFLKLGSTAEAEERLLFGLLAWQTIIGIGFFAAAVMCYAKALRVLPLHTAQAIASLQFLGAIAVAVIFFEETISGPKWLGIALISVGLVLVVR